MPQVDFYVLSSPGERELLRVACRIAEKAWRQGHRVMVLADEDDLAARVDDALWTFKDDAFVPHERWSRGDAPGAPVLIGCDPGDTPVADVLVNLGAEPPPWHRHCERVAEVVGADDERKSRGRARYRQYREAGVELRTHEV